MLQRALGKLVCHAVLSVLLLSCCTGCPVVSNRPAPGRLVTQQDPEYGRAYRLYVPSHYQASRRWPLVVTCHGTRPFDTARFQLDEWKGLGEEKGFLVVAPELVGTTAMTASTEEQIRRQMEDERAILSIVRAVRAGYAIDDTRVFLTGWSAGSYAVLFTGLRNPDVFRAVAVRQGNFKAEYFEPCIPFLDHHQPALVTFGSVDPLKEGSEGIVQWLRSQGITPEIKERLGTHRRDPDPVYGFFVSVVRQRPLIRIAAQDDPVDDMQVKFSVRTSLQPARYLWDFGDEQRSTEETPVHRYERPGLYTVRIALYTARDTPFVRHVQLQVPRIRLGAPNTGIEN